MEESKKNVRCENEKLTQKELKELLGGNPQPGSSEDVSIPFCATTKKCTFRKKKNA